MCDPRCRYQPAIDAVAFIAIAIAIAIGHPRSATANPSSRKRRIPIGTRQSAHFEKGGGALRRLDVQQ
ncbi:hypothetical protein IEQ11_00270 [Lysobacter capsici]|uniref:hypothetical protein n=1 Tax=Lysobacter capsici TaxID=435897 RepID=UPI001781E9BA|nr:hypothetical protein [Lysobacter capsici]UOF15139.1 hypothetical protein IEQ11_00270 [Lysobacter capsici]